MYPNEKHPNEEQALKLLRDAGCTDSVVAHCVAVKNLAMELYGKIRGGATPCVNGGATPCVNGGATPCVNGGATPCVNGDIYLDRDLILAGALLHDIGRSVTHDITHAVEGVRIAQRLGLPRPIIDIIQRHIGAGLTKEEAGALGLPPGDYIPLTREEKLVSYADNLVSGTRVDSYELTVEKFGRILGDGHPGIRRFIDMHEEITSWPAGK
jgi:uncharacterized protein